MDVNYANKTISKAYNTKFLGLHIDSTLSWKLHIEQVLHTLSAACYALRSLKPYMSLEAMKMVYYAHFHSTDSTKVFKMQKRAIRIITGRNRDSCRNLFKDLNILPFYSQYIFLILLFVINNKSMYKLNSDIHNINTRQKLNLHQHSSNLSLYQKGVYSFGIKMFSNLPESLKY